MNCSRLLTFASALTSPILSIWHRTAPSPTQSLRLVALLFFLHQQPPDLGHQFASSLTRNLSIIRSSLAQLGKPWTSHYSARPPDRVARSLEERAATILSRASLPGSGGHSKGFIPSWTRVYQPGPAFCWNKHINTPRAPPQQNSRNIEADPTPPKLRIIPILIRFS